ncbi:uncharacterized protein LOC126959190 [Macaca thibetana thibetana]|uniref:uncharacterized protein LOC126959190 n=1 Tax=Macaca thibetana thibetana TaxID=257877 RepID=UPI0021BCBA3B|nr:uncharacterized protein LOC126959190 [Macaca thibetana thibetana]
MEKGQEGALTWHCRGAQAGGKHPRPPPSPGPGGAAPSRLERAPRLRCRRLRLRRNEAAPRRAGEKSPASDPPRPAGPARRGRRRRRASAPSALLGCGAHTDVAPLPDWARSARQSTRAGGRPGHGARPFPKSWRGGCTREREAASLPPAADNGPHHLIIKKIKIKIEQKEKVDIKWNLWERDKGCRTEETGNCRGPGTQEEMLIQLIGDPVLAPAVPKRRL